MLYHAKNRTHLPIDGLHIFMHMMICQSLDQLNPYIRRETDRSTADIVICICLSFQQRGYGLIGLVKRTVILNN